MTTSTTGLSVLICEPVYELRKLYVKHFEHHHVSVHAIDHFSSLFDRFAQSDPRVILLSLYYPQSNVEKLLQQVAQTHQRSSVVLLSHGEMASTEHLLGVTVTAHLHKQSTSPKEVVSKVLELLTL